MKWLAVVVAACGSAPPAAPHAIEPTGPELVMQTPGATAFAIDGSDVYWLAPGSGVWKGSARIADADEHARGLVLLHHGSAVEPVLIHELDTGIAIDGTDPVVASGDGHVVGTSTMLYQGSDATPIDGGVRALALDGDDVFFGNTSIFEKYGHGPVNRLGPAGGPVTAMAVDPAYVYWAIATGDRDPAIYRAKRAKPELELVTRVGSASQLSVSGEFLYWLDVGEIRRIRRQK